MGKSTINGHVQQLFVCLPEAIDIASWEYIIIIPRIPLSCWEDKNLINLDTGKGEKSTFLFILQVRLKPKTWSERPQEPCTVCDSQCLFEKTQGFCNMYHVDRGYADEQKR